MSFPISIMRFFNFTHEYCGQSTQGRCETPHLSEAQQQEILRRDEEYEAGKAETYTLKEVITHFSSREK